MFYKIITGNRFQTVIIIFLVALGIWMPAFLSPESVSESSSETSMPLYSLFSSLLEGHVLLTKLLVFILVIFEAFMLVRINAKFVLVQQRTFLPALFFIIIAGHNPVLLQWNAVLPASLFVILLLDIIFRSYGDDSDSYRYFEAGIVLVLGSLLYAPFVYLLVFIWFAALVQRPFYWREYLFPVLGIFIPYVFVFAFLFFSEKSIPEFFVTFKSNFKFNFAIPEYLWIYWLFGLYAAILVGISTIYLLKVFQFRKIYIRDYFMVLFWLFIITLVIYTFLSDYCTGLAYLLAIPVSFILTNYFINARKGIGNKILLYILLLFTLLLILNNLFTWT
jgi:hypothetical protein